MSETQSEKLFVSDAAVRTYKLALPALILLTPFLVFLDYNSYCLACAETWIVLSGLIVLAMACSVVMLLGGWIVSGLVMAVLITAFVDLQFAPRNWTDWGDEWAAVLLFSGMQTLVLSLFLKEKFYTITATIFLTFFVVTVFQLALPSRNNDSRFGHLEPAVHAPPRIIHLILDEHIGIEGIPTDIEGGLAAKNLITRFYLKHGFQLSGGAFSRFYYTHNSLGNMLNFSVESDSSALISGRGPFNLLRNKYFELLSERKYRIEVLTSGWVDLCSYSTVVISRCITKNWRILDNFANVDLPVFQKVQVLYSRYLNQSIIVAAIVYVLDAFKARFPALASSMSQWRWALDPERTRTDSLNSLADLKVVWSDILSVPHGTVFFAHLSIPHYPYVALSNCSIRPPNRDFLWHSRGLFDQPRTNTVVSRKERYKHYFEQLECLYLRLDELFDRMRAAGVYDDSIIIFHGDHGSRIVMTDPISGNRHALTKQDLVDGFSTLFAVKLPGRRGGYDKSLRPLEQLFAEFVFEAGLTPTRILPEKSEPHVYLITDHDTDPIRILYTPPN